MAERGPTFRVHSPFLSRRCHQRRTIPGYRGFPSPRSQGEPDSESKLAHQDAQHRPDKECAGQDPTTGVEGSSSQRCPNVRRGCVPMINQMLGAGSFFDRSISRTVSQESLYHEGVALPTRDRFSFRFAHFPVDLPVDAVWAP